jgi:hypothetical protein
LTAVLSILNVCANNDLVYEYGAGNFAGKHHIFVKNNLILNPISDEFEFFTGDDPSGGTVNYLNYNAAIDQGLFKILPDNSIYIGVDSENKAATGRNSVRIKSKAVYNHGLFILDLAHMPGSACGGKCLFAMFNPLFV